MLDDVLAHVRCGMWFSYRYVRCVHDHLDRKFVINWINSDGPVAWLPISHDLSPVKNYFSAVMKITVYGTTTNDVMGLVPQISDAAATILK